MIKTSRAALLIASTSAVALSAAQPAQAQSTDSDATAVPITAGSASTVQSDVGLEEIVVTAQRRAENAQDVPIAVQTVDGDLAAALGVANPEALGQLMPGVTLNRQGNGVTPYVRGIGTGSAAAGNEPSVALFVDDIYIPSAQGSVFDFNSVESISVLKGPQGTLFGRNATGGVLQVKTLDPSEDLEIKADLTYANYDRLTAAGYANAGITENVAFNVAAYRDKQSDGWGRNVLTGRDVFTSHSYGARAKLLIELSENDKLLLAAVYDRRRSDQGGFNQNIIAGTFGTGRFSPGALGVGFYDAVVDFPSLYRTEFRQFSGKYEHDFGNVTLKSITAIGKVRSDATSDLETSPIPFVNSTFGQGSKTFTQEVQLLSNQGSAVNWILGAFYLNDSSDFTISSTGTAFGGGVSRGHGEQKTDSYSGFAQMGAEILPKLNATLGVRYTQDRRTFLAFGSFNTTNSAIFRDARTYKQVTGRFALDYHVSDDIMVYAAYNRGFKSGVFNIAGVTGAATSAPPPAAPEELNAYTAGVKTELFDRRVRLNVEAYFYDYTNIQVPTLVAGAQVVTNAGAARIKGIDAELTFKPFRNFTVSAAMSYADGNYTSFPAGPQFFPLPPNTPIAIPAGCAATVPTYPTGAGTLTSRACNLSGNRTVQTVPFSSTLTGNYSIPTEVGEFQIVGSWARGGNYFFEPDNNPNTRQPKTDIVNASIGWTSPSETFGLRVFSNNLTKQKYSNSIVQSTLGSTKYSPAPPRTYGISAHVQFR